MDHFYEGTNNDSSEKKVVHSKDRGSVEIERNVETFLTRVSSKVVGKISSVVSPKKREVADIADVVPKASTSTKSIENSWTVIEEIGKSHNLSLRKDEDPEKEEKIRRFLEILSAPVADIDTLRELSWYGIPSELRAQCWQLLLGCLPLELKKRTQYAALKRAEYRHLVSKHYSKLEGIRDTELLQQIQVDCPRTMPKGAPLAIFKDNKVLQMLEHILMVWSKEHPLIDYFQGLGDIVGEMLIVLLSSHLDLNNYHPNYLTQEIADLIEADAYWCMTKMLNAMEPYYKQGLFPGMQVMMDKLKDLTKLADAPLQKHMEFQGVEFVQFSLRWMLCLLTRELNASCVQRLWDAYFSEGPDFSTFHIYVCAAFLTHFAKELKEMEFSDMIMFLQHLPTDTWEEKDAQKLLERAYEIGDMEVSIKDSYHLAVQATGLLLTLFVIVLAAQATPMLKK